MKYLAIDLICGGSASEELRLKLGFRTLGDWKGGSGGSFDEIGKIRRGVGLGENIINFNSETLEFEMSLGH